MLKTIKYYTNVAKCYLRLSIQKQIEYPMDIICCFVMIPLMYGTGILLLYFMVKSYQPLDGWTFPQLAFLYGLGDLSHGLMIVFAVQNWWIGDYASRGDFDRMLLRPINVYFQFSATYINVIGIMDVLVGATIFLYSCHLLDFHWTLINAGKIILIVIGATFIRSSLFTIFCSVGFWTKRSGSMFQLLNDFLERTTLYPLSIYPKAFQLILTIAIPIAFISFFPTCEFIGISREFNFPISMAICTPLIGAIMFMLANKVFNFGLKNYESAGS